MGNRANVLLMQGKALSDFFFFFTVTNPINLQRTGILVIYGSLKIHLLLDFSLPINKV